MSINPRQLYVCLTPGLRGTSHEWFISDLCRGAGWEALFIKRDDLVHVPEDGLVYIALRMMSRLGDRVHQFKGRLVTSAHVDFYLLNHHRPQEFDAMRRFSEDISAISGVNRRLVDQMAQRLDREVYYTPGGVDLRWFHPRRRRGAAEGNKVGVIGNTVVQIRGRKGGALIKESCKLVGWAKYTPHLSENFIPHRKMGRYYRNLFCYVCASDVEGGPLTVIEAMACGTPVISTHVGIVPDVIQNGVNGILVKRDINQIANAITRLKDPTLWRNISEAGIETVAKYWSIEASGRLWNTFLEAGRKKDERD